MATPEQLGHTNTQNSCTALCLAAAALLLSVMLAWGAGKLFLDDLTFTAAEVEISFWGRGNYQPTATTRSRIGSMLDTLLAGAPQHPGYLGLAANYYGWEAYRADTSALGRALGQQAVETQFAAQRSRPAYRQGWLTMVGYAERAEGARRQLELAQERLRTLQRY